MEFQATIQGFANSFFQPLADNVLTKPEFFIGIVVFVGYLLLKRPIVECIGGFIKTAVGFMILSVGSNGLINTFRPILTGLNMKYELNAAVVDPYFGLNAANEAISELGLSVSFTMVSLLVAFLWNILLVALKRFTKLRVLYLTGHVMVQMSTMFTWIIFLLFPELRNFTGALVIGLILGTYQSVSANLNVEFISEITDNGGFAIGHHQQLAVFLIDKFGSRLDRRGKPNKRMEEVELPSWLSIFSDNIVSTSVIMTVFFGAILLLLGEDFMRELDTGFAATQAFPFYIISKCFSFTVYFTILLKGVSIFISEITESFRGISERLIPGSIAGIDCPAIFGYTTGNTIIWGFLWCGVASFVCVLLMVLFKSPWIIIPGFVPMFFDAGTVAVFANRRAGAKGAAICCSLLGCVHILLGAVATNFFQLYQYGGWIGMFDEDTIWLTFGVIMKYLSIPGIVLMIAAMLVVPQLQYRRNKEKYFTYSA